LYSALVFVPLLVSHQTILSKGLYRSRLHVTHQNLRITVRLNLVGSSINPLFRVCSIHQYFVSLDETCFIYKVDVVFSNSKGNERALEFVYVLGFAHLFVGYWVFFTSPVVSSLRLNSEDGYAILLSLENSNSVVSLQVKPSPFHSFWNVNRGKETSEIIVFSIYTLVEVVHVRLR